MKVRRLIMVFALTLLAGGFGASRGLAHMQQTYYGVCGQLSGFPGLLEKMHLFDQGNCRLKANSTTVCQGNSACSIKSPSGSRDGKCTQMPTGCTCVPN